MMQILLRTLLIIVLVPVISKKKKKNDVLSNSVLLEVFLMGGLWSEMHLHSPFPVPLRTGFVYHS